MFSHNTGVTIPTVSSLLKSRKREDTLLFIVVFITVFSLTPLLVLSGVTIGFGLTLGGITAVTIAMLVVRWPVVGFFVVAGCTLLVDQGPLIVNNFGFYLYVFFWPPSLQGLIERPIGFFILFIFFMYICHNLLRRRKLLQGGELLLPFLFFLLCVAWGIIYGLTTGGDLKIIVVEVRPFWYLFVSYLLAYNLVTRKEHIRLFFWLVIFSAGVKSLLGIYIYVVILHGDLTGHREIMAHEESFFFVALILLVVLFSIHYSYRPQLFAALLVLPFLLVALVANQRRADYIALLVGLMVVWVLVFVVKRRARKALLIFGVLFLVLGGAYVAAFWQTGGSLGEPARAIVSVFYPDPTDVSSNVYRLIEDTNLKYTVKLNPMGLGFGKPFLQFIPLPNILILDPYYLYVPHNTIYWVWMRLGPIGYFALWYIFGAIIIRGCIIARKLRNRYLQLVAIYIVAVTFMEVIVAYADYQLYFYRNVIYLGLLAGILMKLPSLDDMEEQHVHESSHDNAKSTIANVGSGYTQLSPAKDPCPVA